MRAKEFLNQVKKLDRVIENKRNEKERYLELALNTAAGAAPDTGVKVQSSGSQSRMADAVDRSIDIGREIDAALQRLFAARQQIVSVIEQLDTASYDLLYKVYFGEAITDKQGRKRFVYMSLQDVADMYDKSYSWATSLHGNALSRVQKIIDGMELSPIVDYGVDNRRGRALTD